MDLDDEGAQPSARRTLELHAARRLSTRATMRALGIEWPGDLIRTLNANGLTPPLGDVQRPDAVIAEVAGMIAGRLGEHLVPPTVSADGMIGSVLEVLLELLTQAERQPIIEMLERSENGGMAP